MGKGDKGKGKKGPMYGSCWNCGGDHFMTDCPTKGKGKGGKGLHIIEGEAWHSDEAHAPTIKALGCLTVTPRDVQQNTGRNANLFSTQADTASDGYPSSVSWAVDHWIEHRRACHWHGREGCELGQLRQAQAAAG